MSTLLLARGFMEAIPVLGIIFSFILVMVHVQNKGKENRERFRLLEEAIRRGELDEQMKADLMEGVGGKRPPQRPSGRSHLSRLFFGFGWLALFVGLGLLITDAHDLFLPGCIVSAIGFGFVTLPLAYRELDARQRQTN